MKKVLLFSVMIFILFATSTWAAQYGGIEFPQGAVSFADEVVLYQPPNDVQLKNGNPMDALGIPDYSHANDRGYVSLGDQGLLILKFTNNALTTSGNLSNDLYIFEIGGNIEPTSVDISKDGLNWIRLEDTTGGRYGIDIDEYIGRGVVLGEKYNYVRLIDLLPHQSGGDLEGADIDAVGAISSAAVPIPGVIWLLGSGLLGLVGFRKRLKS